MTDTPSTQAQRRIAEAAEQQRLDEPPPEETPPPDDVSDAPADQANRMDTKPGTPPVGAGYPTGTYPKGAFGYGSTEENG